MSMIVVELVCY